MAFLNILSQAVAPTGLWSELILNVFSFVGNYGWRIVLFTICLKLVLSPLDIFQRYKARKNQLIMLKIKPQMDKLQKMYGDDPRVLSQKQMELNKKAGISYFSSCLPAIVTLVVFMTLLFMGLQPISQYQNFRQYELLYGTYTQYCNDELVEQRYQELYPQMYDESLAEAESKRPEIRAAEVEALKEEIGQKAYDDVMAQKTDDMTDQQIDELEKQATAAKNQALNDFIAEQHTAEIDERTEKAKYLLDTYNGTGYYFYYEREQLTTLGFDTLYIVTERAEQYVIYADICTLSKEDLAKRNIIFKKIPRDIKRF